MTLKDVGKEVEELGSDTAAAVLFCFFGAGAGGSARALPFAALERAGRSASGRALDLAAIAAFFSDFGDSTLTRAFFLRLGLAAREGFAARADMIEDEEAC